MIKIMKYIIGICNNVYRMGKYWKRSIEEVSSYKNID